MTPRRADPNNPYCHVGSDAITHQELDHCLPLDEGHYEAGNYFKHHTTVSKAATVWRAVLRYLWGKESLDTVIVSLLEARRVMDNINGKE